MGSTYCENPGSTCTAVLYPILLSKRGSEPRTFRLSVSTLSEGMRSVDSVTKLHKNVSGPFQKWTTIIFASTRRLISPGGTRESVPVGAVSEDMKRRVAPRGIIHFSTASYGHLDHILSPPFGHLHQIRSLILQILSPRNRPSFLELSD